MPNSRGGSEDVRSNDAVPTWSLAWSIEDTSRGHERDDACQQCEAGQVGVVFEEEETLAIMLNSHLEQCDGLHNERPTLPKG